jgi:hypothetical protein
LLWHLWQLDSKNNDALKFIYYGVGHSIFIGQMLGIAVNDFCQIGQHGSYEKTAINLIGICAGHMTVLGSYKVRESKSKKNPGLLHSPGKY